MLIYCVLEFVSDFLCIFATCIVNKYEYIVLSGWFINFSKEMDPFNK